MKDKHVVNLKKPMENQEWRYKIVKIILPSLLGGSVAFSLVRGSKVALLASTSNHDGPLGRETRTQTPAFLPRVAKVRLSGLYELQQ